MDPHASQEMDSQSHDEDPFFSQASYSHASYYPYSNPPFHMPSHSFQAMLNAPSLFPHSFHIHPPPFHPSPTHTPTSLPSSNPTLPMETMEAHPPKSIPQQKRKTMKTNRREAANEEPQMKKTRSSRKKTIVNLDNEEEEDVNKSSKWKDFWVDQLIHVRGGLNDEFNNPIKQGVNLWSKVATKLTSMYPDFDKDSESCRKKWQKVLCQYRLDKAHNAISGNDRKYTCK
ncbi:hypothetical protein KP509_08G041000 [Ceratopteris richardii]|uniref:Myb/SANT-like DNA-binding domain-containing protein n=1 Tax=Ceratopteris richardii TaxID=49495 RepID=A0A8T2UCK2_CERRI|nr:hypothetical protein KP509_08G041000 [Ceratopteris richardii]